MTECLEWECEETRVDNAPLNGTEGGEAGRSSQDRRNGLVSVDCESESKSKKTIAEKGKDMRVVMVGDERLTGDDGAGILD